MESPTTCALARFAWIHRRGTSGDRDTIIRPIKENVLVDQIFLVYGDDTTRVWLWSCVHRKWWRKKFSRLPLMIKLKLPCLCKIIENLKCLRDSESEFLENRDSFFFLLFHPYWYLKEKSRNDDGSHLSADRRDSFFRRSNVYFSAFRRWNEIYSQLSKSTRI